MSLIKRPKSLGQASAPRSEVRIRKVAPLEPSADRERAQLLEDLTSMGCAFFLGKPWGFKNEAMVRELLDGALWALDYPPLVKKRTQPTSLPLSTS